MVINPELEQNLKLEQKSLEVEVNNLELQITPIQKKL